MLPASARVATRLYVAAAHFWKTPLHARKRSKDDKEYFIQDWLALVSASADLEVTQSGRNSYPDFWLSHHGHRIGCEVKSLAHQANGKPARTDLDFNSTAPLPNKDGADVFLAFALYRPAGAGHPLDQRITTLVIADVSLINDDREFVHLNQGVDGFGSYGDGFIRNRRMYLFNHPVTIAAREAGVDLRDRATLILPANEDADAAASDAGLSQVCEITRTPTDQLLVSYDVNVRTGELTPKFEDLPPQPPRTYRVWTA